MLKIIFSTFILACCAAPACSTPDAADEAELERRIAALPATKLDPLITMTMNINSASWLKGRPQNDQALFVECRELSSSPTPWLQTGSHSAMVFDLVNCLLLNIDRTYADCAKAIGDALTQRALQTRTIMFDQKTMQPLNAFECRWRFDARYDPKELPAKATDASKLHRSDIVEAIVASPVPPPGVGILPELVPLLCPLGAGPGWGCPPTPDQIGAGSQSAASGDFQ